MSKKIESQLVGRSIELAQIRACLSVGKNVLLEGPVGVGKTQLAIAVTQALGIPVFRIDGDSRYSEQKLTGWFDPPTVIKTGFVKEAFFPGPLVQAMQEGGALFINELNRLPEGVQNVLLPAIDERWVSIPRLGAVQAKAGFLVIATQNPKEFVATSHLSEAILDRFELVVLDYQSEPEEIEIVVQGVSAHLQKRGSVESASLPRLAEVAVRLVRLTRKHPRIRRGASVRAALSIAEISLAFMVGSKTLEDAFLEAAMLAVPTRIELERDADSEGSRREDLQALIHEWVQVALSGKDEKKKREILK